MRAVFQASCRQGFPVLYQRVPRLTKTRRIAHADRSFGRLPTQLARIDVLILDDWGMPLPYRALSITVLRQQPRRSIIPASASRKPGTTSAPPAAALPA